MTLVADARFALSVLRGRPGVPLLVTGLFALGLGLAGGLWAVVDAVALRPLPYPNAHELVAVMESHPERGLMSVTAANFWDWSPRIPALKAVVGLGSLESSLVARGMPARVVGTKVTERFFDVISVMPVLGRPFTEADYRGESRAVILSNRLWERSFGRAPDVLGTTVLLDGRDYTVVGVMPLTFKPIGPSDVWVPWVMSAEERTERRFHMVGVMARLQPERAAAEAERELQGEYRQLAAAHPATTDRWTGRVVPLRELLLGDSRRVLAVLTGTVLALLAVAAVNVVGLLWAWLRQRRQEIIVRLALGATVGRIVRQFVVEALVWGTGGIVVGTCFAVLFVGLFGAVGVSPALEYDFEPRIDARAVSAMAVIMGTLAVATTAIPAWLGARRATDLVPRRASATGRWGQRAAIASQVAASLVLVCLAAVLLSGLRSVVDVAARPAAATVAADVSLTETRYHDEPSQARFFQRLLQALSARPEIARAGAASYVPPGRIYGNVRFSIEGRSGSTDSQTTLVSAVDPVALGMLGVPVQRGRAIEDRDDSAAPHVGIISAALAHRYWPKEDPIGRRITPVGAERPVTIVGVVDNVRQPLSGDPRAESVLYVAYRQVPWPFMTVLIEPTRDLAPALAALREEIARIDPVQAAGQARLLDEIRREWLTQPRLRSRIVALFAGTALLLTLTGLWARVSFSVAARTRELAIRQALGARPADIVRAAAGEVALVAATGAAAGLTLLPVMIPTAQGIVAGLPTPDMGVVALPVVCVVVLALVSGLLPARTACRASPAEVLRAE